MKRSHHHFKRKAGRVTRLLPFPIFILFAVVVFVLTGCGNDPLTNPVRNTLEISGLSLTNQTVNAGDTATVTALTNYSGQAGDLIYTWKATAGKIIGTTASVTYLAPDTPGTYTITLELTDGFVVDQRSITVEVIASHSLSIGSNTYWAGDSTTPELKYQVKVTTIFRRDVMLRYEILQDQARAGAFLSIYINGAPLVREKAIGEVQPVGQPVIKGDVDVSSIIKGPGQYEVTLTVEVTKAVERGWLLRSAQLIGAEGSAVRL